MADVDSPQRLVEVEAVYALRNGPSSLTSLSQVSPNSTAADQTLGDDLPKRPSLAQIPRRVSSEDGGGSVVASLTFSKGRFTSRLERCSSDGEASAKKETQEKEQQTAQQSSDSHPQQEEQNLAAERSSAPAQLTAASPSSSDGNDAAIDAAQRRARLLASAGRSSPTGEGTIFSFRMRAVVAKQEASGERSGSPTITWSRRTSEQSSIPNSVPNSMPPSDDGLSRGCSQEILTYEQQQQLNASVSRLKFLQQESMRAARDSGAWGSSDGSVGSASSASAHYRKSSGGDDRARQMGGASSARRAHGGSNSASAASSGYNIAEEQLKAHALIYARAKNITLAEAMSQLAQGPKLRKRATSINSSNLYLSPGASNGGAGGRSGNPRPGGSGSFSGAINTAPVAGRRERPSPGTPSSLGSARSSRSSGTSLAAAAALAGGAQGDRVSPGTPPTQSQPGSSRSSRSSGTSAAVAAVAAAVAQEAQAAEAAAGRPLSAGSNGSNGWVRDKASAAMSGLAAAVAALPSLGRGEGQA